MPGQQGTVIGFHDHLDGGLKHLEELLIPDFEAAGHIAAAKNDEFSFVWSTADTESVAGLTAADVPGIRESTCSERDFQLTRQTVR